MIARAAMGRLPEADASECLSRFLGDHGCTGTNRIESGKVGLAPAFLFLGRAKANPRLPFLLVSKRGHDSCPGPYPLMERLQIVFLVRRMNAVVH